MVGDTLAECLSIAKIQPYAAGKTTFYLRERKLSIFAIELDSISKARSARSSVLQYLTICEAPRRRVLMNKGKNMEEKDARDPNTLRPYKKPQVHVVGKTVSLIRGDYGKKNDSMRNYQD